MARGITESDVWQASDALLIDGARPTIERVRQKLGRGSPNTVGPHLESWFRTLGQRITSQQATAQVLEVPGPIIDIATHCWQTALQLAQQNLERDSQHERAQSFALREELEMERARLAREAEHLRQVDEGREKALRVATEQLAEAGKRIAALEEHLARRDAEIERVQAEQVRWIQQVATLQAQGELERAAQKEERTRLDEQFMVMQRRASLEVDRARQELKANRQEFEESSRQSATRFGQLESVNLDLARKLEKLKHIAHDLEENLTSAHRQLLAKEQLMNELRSQFSVRETDQLAQTEQLRLQLASVLTQLRHKDEEQSRLLQSILNTTTHPRKRAVKSV